jgi:4-hydroxybenzoate polyprenyltransferase
VTTQPLQKVSSFFQFIRFSHTIFALPFAFMAMWVAAGGWPSFKISLLIVVCMVSARTAAMCFNRLVDWSWDVANPRTQTRQKLASKPTAIGACVFSLGIFKFACWWLNPLCLLLSPVAVLLIFFYSFTKRFTWLSHAFLGLALAAAPVGAWAAVRGELYSPAPFCLAAAVLAWVWGFDLIYSTQDVAFDQQVGLFSFPARFGLNATFVLARILHLVAWLILGGFGLLTHQPEPYWICLMLVAGALVYEHRLCRTGDVQKINQAFFQMNALVSVLLLTGVGLGIWMPYWKN